MIFTIIAPTNPTKLITLKWTVGVSFSSVKETMCVQLIIITLMQDSQTPVVNQYTNHFPKWRTNLVHGKLVKKKRGCGWFLPSCFVLISVTWLERYR
jgi:hypothetical protein